MTANTEKAPEVESGAESKQPNELGVEQMLNSPKVPSIADLAQAFLSDDRGRSLREVALELFAGVK